MLSNDVAFAADREHNLRIAARSVTFDDDFYDLQMKTNPDIQKKFDSVLYFKKIKEQIAKELAGKSFQEQRK